MSKNAFITGCSSGIGAATAALMKSQGWRVLGFDLKEPTDNVDEFVQIDLSSQASIDTAVSKATGTALTLCNIAGVPPTLPPEVQIRVNFLGLKSFTEQIAEKLEDGASIVNVASMAGLAWEPNVDAIRQLLNVGMDEDIPAFLDSSGIPEPATYAFSKQAVIGWTVMAAQRWKDRGITIKSVSPGPIKTPILQDFMDTIVKQQVQLPEEYLGDPENIASVIGFLAGDGGQWING
ncbi:MAG: SDR family oxidoreductase, partial [Pseudomonadota bacterium]